MEFTNQLKKYIRSLHQLKFRQKYNKFIAEGPKICEEYLVSGRFNIQHIFCTTQGYEENVRLLNNFPGKTIVIKDKDLQYISNLKHANRILIVADIPSSLSSADLPGDEWALYLEDLSDPGNMGTVIRIADWFGIRHVHCSPDCVDVYNPKVVQSAMGSHNRVAFLKTSMQNLTEYYKHRYGLILEGEPLKKLVNPAPGLIILGNESRGISEATQKLLSHRIRIEGKGGAESLNASVACAIACYQLTL